MTKAEDKEERLTIRLMQQMLFGKSTGSPRPSQAPHSREVALKHRIWESGRIGKVERAISRKTEAGKVYTTGELVRAVYRDRFYNDDLNAPPIEIKSYHYQRIRKSAPTFMDCVGRDEHKPGRPWLWMARDEYFPAVRARKTQRDKIRRQSASKTKVQP
jgi:hypothetical protein